MVRLLRWATFLLLVLFVVGLVVSYPTLRDRILTPMLVANARLDEAVALVSATGQATTVPMSPAATLPSAPAPTNTSPALIIEASTPESLPTNELAIATNAPQTPVVVATTSLLPASPVVQSSQGYADAAGEAIGDIAQQSRLGITSIEVAAIATSTTGIFGEISAGDAITTATLPTATGDITLNVASVIVTTPIPPTPTSPPGVPPESGEKGYEAPLTAAILAPPLPATSVATGINSTPTPVVVNPIVAMTVAVTPAITSVAITPVIAISVELTPPLDTPTPLPAGPFANAESPLYSGPDLNSAVVGTVQAGEQLNIVGLYTEGTWYLLVNGTWLPGAIVENLPFAIPLVFPTVTPVPSSTPTVTFTPLPTATLVGSATPSPTPTSLDQAICACSEDQLDCLGSVFSSQAQAQQCFEYCFRQTGKDIHNLDPNLNGQACENLP